MIEKEIGLLEELYEGMTLLGTGFVELVKDGKTSLKEEEYQSIMDVIEKVERFLEEKKEEELRQTEEQQENVMNPSFYEEDGEQPKEEEVFSTDVYVKWAENESPHLHEMEIEPEKFEPGTVYQDEFAYELVADYQNQTGYFFYAKWK